MKPSALARARLQSQGIEEPSATSPAGIVAHLGAMQAQDYLASLWAIGVRLPGSTEAHIEQAIAEGKIIRTWPMRGTLHFVAPADVRWMLELLTPRIVASAAGRHRQLELDDAIFTRTRKLLIQHLSGGKCLTRDRLYELLEKGGISTTGQRGYHILWLHAQEGLICCGPREGKQPTFVLLDEWVPSFPKLDRDESLAELARRYFTSHGPATLQDFVWWSGLKISDAKTALHLASPKLVQVGTDHWTSPDLAPSSTPKNRLHLLPGFDEFLLGYKDRSAMLDPAHAARIVPGNNGLFLPMIVVDGKIVGTWKRAIRKKTLAFSAEPFRPLAKPTEQKLSKAVSAYGAFLGLSVALD